MTFTYLPMINPEIITVLSLMLLFHLPQDGIWHADPDCSAHHL